MIGILIVTHGRLSEELLAATEHVVGDLERARALAIGPDDDLERRRADIEKAIKAVNDGSGVVIVTDMFGGTPANLAITFLEKGKVEVLAGANLPMLVKLAEARETMKVADAAEAARAAGCKYIAVASRILSGDAA
ncbi:MAG: PTS sugar transporter subunit IIA [Maricaulaceae bacterium]|jgi:PTS system mannose-specific IIA component